MAERDIIARLRLRGEEFTQELRRRFGGVPREADAAGTEAGQRFASGFGTKMLGLTAAAASGIALVSEAVSKSLDLAQNLDETSRGLNVNAERLQEWRHAAREVGATSEELDASLGSLNTNIRAAHDGNREAQQSFVDLGVGFETVNGRARETDAVFADVIDRLSKITDPSKRAELAAKLMGEEFQRLDPLAVGGAAGLERLQESAHNFGVVLTDDAIRNLNATNNDLKDMQDILSIRIAGVVGENSQALMGLADTLITVAENGIKAGSSIQQFLSTDFGSYTSAVGSMALNPVGTLGGWWLQRGREEPSPDLLGIGAAWDVFNQARHMPVSDTAARPKVDPKKRRGKTDAEKAAEKAERERLAAIKRAWEHEKKLSSSIGETIQKQQDSIRVEEVRAGLGDRAAAQEEARLEFEREHPEAVAKTVGQLAVMLGVTNDIVTANKTLTAEQKAQLQADIDKMSIAKQGAIREAGEKADQKATKEAAEAAEEKARLDKAATDKWQREQEAAIRDVAFLYEDLFTGGIDRVWKDFKAIGLRAVAEVAAKWTLATISGQSFNVGQAFNASVLDSPLGSLFGGLSRSPAVNDNRPSPAFEAAFKDMSDLGISNIMPGDQPIPSAGIPKGGSLLDQAGFALAASSLIGLTGIGGKGAGSQIGGMAGSFGGQTFGKTIGALGKFGGPIGAIGGAILGSIAGSLLDGVLNPNRTARANLTSISSMSLAGKDKGNYGAATGLAGSVTDGLKQIADALGAELGSFNTTIGVRGGDYRINKNGTSLKIKNGAVNFGQDSEAAVAAAIQDAINDGVLLGLSRSQQNILKSGQDLEAAINKAALIGTVPKLLKQRLDPLGAALDEIDTKFRDLAAALKEGGASAEEIAQARQLWQLEREDTIKQIGAASSTLKGFLDSLSIGSNSPLSLRQQEAAAREALSPYTAQIEAAKAAKAEVDRLKASGASATDIKAAEEKARIAAGKIDQEAFQSAAQALLGIERSINGSSSGYFDQFNQIKQLTGDAIALIDAVTAKTGDAATDPFSSLIAASTSDTANILADHTKLLNQAVTEMRAMNDNLNSFGDFGAYLKAMKQKGWY